jgi:hypothetical protein
MLCKSSQKMKGNVLIESLIGVLLTLWLGAGMAHVAARLLVEKADTKIMNSAVIQLKNLLQNQGEGLCNQSSLSITIAGKTVPVEVECQSNTITVLASGKSLEIEAPQYVVLRASASDLGLKGNAAVEVRSGI